MSLRPVAPLALAVAFLAAVPATASTDAFRGDLAQVDGHLRIAIERAPEALGDSLLAAEGVCGLGERATSRREVDLAAADWVTLGQLIDQQASAQSRRVAVAFGNADSVLRDLRRRYERRWAGAPERLRELRRGVAATRGGIAVMRAAVAGLAEPFESWKAHECAAATRGVADAFARAPAGLERINAGMSRLWRLAEPPPPRTEGR